MQWDESENAGFSSTTPWLKVNNNYKRGINVAVQERDTQSVLNYFRRVVQLRKDHPTLVYGGYQLLQETHEEIYAYTRTREEDRFLILLGFSSSKSEITLDEIDFERAELLLSNDGIIEEPMEKSFELRPYQACVYRLY